MTSNLIPLPFKGDLIDYLKVNGREIAWLWRDGEAYIPIKPICEILGLAWQPQHRKLMSAEDEVTITIMVTVGADGKQREMLCLSYTDFMMWLAHITPSRVKAEARQAVIATRKEIKLLIGNFYHARIFGEIADRELLLQRMTLDAKQRRPLRGRICQALSYGWDFETLRRNSSASGPKLVAVIKECLELGLIKEAPKGTPFSTAVGQMEFALNG